MGSYSPFHTHIILLTLSCEHNTLKFLTLKFSSQEILQRNDVWLVVQAVQAADGPLLLSSY